MNLTPHGPGFSFVDTVLDGSNVNQLQVTKFLNPDSSYFADHFPGDPLMPGVLLVECAAQAAGCLWSKIESREAGVAYRLAQVLSFKFMEPVYPGQTVVSDVILERTFGDLGQFVVAIFCNDSPVATGKIVLVRPRG